MNRKGPEFFYIIKFSSILIEYMYDYISKILQNPPAFRVPFSTDMLAIMFLKLFSYRVCNRLYLSVRRPAAYKNIICK